MNWESRGGQRMTVVERHEHAEEGGYGQKTGTFGLVILEVLTRPGHVTGVMAEVV